MKQTLLCLRTQYERFLLDSIGMLLIGYSVEDCETPTVELSIRDDCSMKIEVRDISRSSERPLPVLDLTEIL